MADLTPRQRQVLELLTDGATDPQIQRATGLSERRVREIITRLTAILGTDPSRNIRVQLAVRWAAVRHLPSLDAPP